MLLWQWEILIAIFPHFLDIAKGPEEEELGFYASKGVLHNKGWWMCKTLRQTWRVRMCVSLQSQPASSVLQRALAKNQPCINWTPTHTIFSEGGTFQHMCWWMTTGWRYDLKAPNVLSPMTRACQCVSSLTLWGAPTSHRCSLISCHEDQWKTVIWAESNRPG